ncbi:MAG: hypothetical protein M4579_001681 [Chaenotheca gracillima]|nr:MAG: hypothetical protein M4579_001681 [Chaenotheca gracillima]
MVHAQKDGFRANWKCAAACILISMAPFQYGVDFGLIGGMQAMVGFLKVYGYEDPTSPIGYNISTTAQQLISSLMTMGAFLGSLAAGPLATILGRKSCLWLACIMCTVANAIMMGSTNLGGLYAGRLIIGLANGVFMTFSQLYLQECTPARYRGLSLAMFQVWTSVGTLIGTVTDNFTSRLLSKASYMIPLGVIFVVPAIMALGLFFIPESPRWLVGRGRNEQALKSLQWLRPDHEDAMTELKEIQVAIDEERNAISGATIIDMFRNPVDRRRTLLSVAAVSVQAACGVMYMLAYGTYFFEMAKVGNAFENSCILVAVGVVAIIIDLFIMAPYGRRRVFLTTGLIVCGFCQLIQAIVYDKDPGSENTGRVVVAMSVIYIFVYNGAICPFSWLSGGEIPSQRMRSYTFGLSSAVGFLGAWVATFTAPYFINPENLNWGPKYGYIWFPSCIVTAAFIYLYLPELKNRSLEEIDEMFEARLPARKFRHYQCSISEKAATMKVPMEVSLEKGVAVGTTEIVADIKGN